MAAQALIAAQTHDPSRAPNSIHSFFLSSARPDETIAHNVEVQRVGRAFSSVRVETVQGDRHCVSSVVSFHNGERAPEHQLHKPETGAPETHPLSHFIPPGTDPAARECFEIRNVESRGDIANGNYPAQTYWFRSRSGLGDDPAIHCATLVWFSDLSMPWTTDLAYDARHGTRFGASLDHTVWFHRPARADQWLLFTQESIVYAGARALTRGLFFSEDGMLVASAAQETLLRRIPE